MPKPTNKAKEPSDAGDRPPTTGTSVSNSLAPGADAASRTQLGIEFCAGSITGSRAAFLEKNGLEGVPEVPIDRRAWDRRLVSGNANSPPGALLTRPPLPQHT